MEKDSKKSLVVVTGASEGIGAAIAFELARRGCDLLINARNEERLEKRAAELRSFGVNVRTEAGDIGSPETADRIFDAIEEEGLLGRELKLVNNAGIAHIGLLQDMSISEWDRLMAVNLSARFYTSRRAIPLMLRDKCGHIVNISSAWGEVGASMETAYSASKGGVDAFTRALGKELAPSGIAVNALSLGVMDTRMNDCFSEEEKEELCGGIPAGRFGRPEEAARLCADLLECDTYLTGQVIRLDGGWI